MAKVRGTLISMAIATGIGVANGLWFFKPYFEEQQRKKFLRDHPELSPSTDAVEASNGVPPSPSPTTQNATSVSMKAAEGALYVPKTGESAPRDSRQHTSSPSGSAWPILSTVGLWGSRTPKPEEKATNAAKDSAAQVVPGAIDK